MKSSSCLDFYFNWIIRMRLANAIALSTSQDWLTDAVICVQTTFLFKFSNNNLSIFILFLHRTIFRAPFSGAVHWLCTWPAFHISRFVLSGCWFNRWVWKLLKRKSNDGQNFWIKLELDLISSWIYCSVFLFLSCITLILALVAEYFRHKTQSEMLFLFVFNIFQFSEGILLFLYFVVVFFLYVLYKMSELVLYIYSRAMKMVEEYSHNLAMVFAFERKRTFLK